MTFNQKKRKGLVAKFENKLCITKANAIIRIFFFFLFWSCIVATVVIVGTVFPATQTKTKKIDLPASKYVQIPAVPEETTPLTKDDFFKLSQEKTLFSLEDGNFIFLKNHEDIIFSYCMDLSSGEPFYKVSLVKEIGNNFFIVKIDRGVFNYAAFFFCCCFLASVIFGFCLHRVQKKHTRFVWWH